MSVDWYNKNANKFHEQVVNLEVSSIYELFLAELSISSSAFCRILDAGCGTGIFTKIFLEKGYAVEAFDASVEMVKIAGEHCGQKVRHLSFQEMDYVNHFDGIWANASLLHVPKSEINFIFRKFIKAMKMGGIWHLSFKYGSGERVSRGRFFNDYDEEDLTRLIHSFPSLQLIKMYKREDVRPGRSGEYWISALCKRIN